MQDTSSDSRKHRLHEVWLSRGAYVEHFGSREPPVVFPNWRGNPDRCRCGCDGVRYSRSNPENLWESFSPELLWETELLIPQFRALRNTLWKLPGFAWTIFRPVFTANAFKDIVISDPQNSRGGRAMKPLRLLTWSIFSLLLFLLLMAAWLVSRFTLVVLAPLYIVGMAFVLAVMLLVSFRAATCMAFIGLVFLIGAAASFAFEASPALGISLIVAGVCFEYEGRRRRERQNREQLGRVLRIIEQQVHSGLSSGEKSQ